MKEYIHIRNLGPLRNVEINPIQPFTLFIGESASGKSTILKVVALFRYLFKRVNIRSYLKNSNISGSPFRLRIESFLKNCGLIDMVEADTEIVYGVIIDGCQYEIVYKNRKLQPVPKISNKDLSFCKVSFVSENRTIIPTWSVRNTRGADLGFYFSETYNDFDEAAEFIKKLLLHHLPFSFDVKRIKGKKVYYITPLQGDYEQIELKNASSGLQTSTPLVVITSYLSNEFSFKDALRRSVLSYLFENDRISKFKPETELSDLPRYVHIHIEEPELSLYPKAQRGLIDALVKTSLIDNASDRSVSLMLATHSPYIVNQLNVLLKAYYFRDKNPDAVSLDPHKTAVYKVEGGCLVDLRVKDTRSDRWVIDTFPLSQEMEYIANDYYAIKEE